MSLLAYTGLGSIVLTLSALVKLGVELLSADLDGGNLNGSDTHRKIGLPGGEAATFYGVSAWPSNGNGDYSSAQRGRHDSADGAILSGSDPPD